MTTRLGQLEVSYSVRGTPTYRVEIWHDGLKKHRVIKSSEPEVVQRKAQMQVAEWDAKWSQAEALERDRRDKLGQKRQQETNKRLAAERTAEAQRELTKLSGILRHTHDVNDAIDWEQLKDK